MWSPSPATDQKADPGLDAETGRRPGAGSAHRDHQHEEEGTQEAVEEHDQGSRIVTATQQRRQHHGCFEEVGCGGKPDQ